MEIIGSVKQRGSASLAAITAEARRDLQERWAAISSNASLVAEIARGKWRAEQPEGGSGSAFPTLSLAGEIGVINVSGPLFKLSGGVDDAYRIFMGCTPYDFVWRALEACQERGLRGAIMRSNSPGGDVGGVGELADYVYSLRNKFKVWTYAETQCASAAQWIAAQTERTVAHETALLGWIGVVRGPLLDDSAFLEKQGFRVEEIVSKHAKAKRSIPLDDEVLARFQVMADDLGDCFEAAVARGRGVKPEEVAERFGGGDGLIAAKALQAGLIDQVGSFNSTLEALRKELQPASVPVSVPKPAARQAAQATVRLKERTMSKPTAGFRAEEEKPDDKKKGDAKRAEAEGKRAKADAKRADAKKASAEADEMESEDKKDEAKAKRAEAKRCEAEADEMESKAKMTEAEADEMDAEHEEPDGDEDKKALAALSGLRATASLSAHTAAIEAKMVPRAKLTAIESRIATMETERATEKRAEEDARLGAIADRAGSLGYFAGLDATATKVKRDRFIKIARNEPDAAEEIIATLPGARVTGRVTTQGNPTGGRHSSQPQINAFDDAIGGRRVNHGEVDTLEKGSPDLMTKARAHAAQHKISVEEAMVAVAKSDPSLMR